MDDVHHLSKWVTIFNSHFSNISRAMHMKHETVLEWTDIFLFSFQVHKCSTLCPHITQTLSHLHDSSRTHKCVRVNRDNRCKNPCLHFIKGLWYHGEERNDILDSLCSYIGKNSAVISCDWRVRVPFNQSTREGCVKVGSHPSTKCSRVPQTKALKKFPLCFTAVVRTIHRHEN
jgi:hypothetical protein